MLTCAVCQTSEPTEGVTCIKCKHRIRRNLDSLVESMALTTADEQASKTGSGGRTAETPVPGGAEWLNWRHGGDLMGALTSWVRAFCEDYELAGPKRRDLVGIVGWLQARVDTVCAHHPAVDEFARDIADHAWRGRRVAGLLDNSPRIDCPRTLDNGETCNRRLAVNVQSEATIHCRGCGTDWTAARLMVVALASEAEAWVDPEAVAVLVGVDESTLRRWARAGKIRRDHGRYDLVSVREYRESLRVGA